jgi:hypothetical protein
MVGGGGISSCRNWCNEKEGGENPCVTPVVILWFHLRFGLCDEGRGNVNCRIGGIEGIGMFSSRRQQIDNAARL